MTNIECPKCNDRSYFNVTSYTGPYRCMKCRETFAIVIEDGEVKSYETGEQDPNKLRTIKTYYHES